METLETRQQEELKLIKDQAKMDKEALDKQMQMMREADMKTQDRLQKQLDAIVEKERQTNKALQEISQLHEKSRHDAEIMQIKAETIRIKTQLQEENLKRMIEKQEEDRARERSDIRKVQTQLQEQLNANLAREKKKDEYLMKLEDRGFLDRLFNVKPE